MKVIAKRPLHEVRQEEAAETERIATIQRLEAENLTLMEANLELYMDYQDMKSEDLTNKEAIIELYMMIGGM